MTTIRNPLRLFSIHGHLPSRAICFQTRRRLARAVIVVGMLFAVSASAQRLDQVGPVREIAEPDLLLQIEARLQALQQSGELADLQRGQAARAVNRVRNPESLAGLTTARLGTTHYFDPTFTLDKAIADGQGRLLYPAGTRRNPLEVVSWDRLLLFFDATDPRQRVIADELRTRYGARLRPVLVGGSYLDLMKQWGVTVYYDQQSQLVRRFRITQVPALVYQEGLRLRVDSIGVAP